MSAATALPDAVRFAQLRWRNRPLQLEYQWVGAPSSELPPLVFLHEGLGSLAMWKDFPERFCQAHGLHGLVFSRYGRRCQSISADSTLKRALARAV